jgi:hypothetical protein
LDERRRCAGDTAHNLSGEQLTLSPLSQGAKGGHPLKDAPLPA